MPKNASITRTGRQPLASTHAPWTLLIAAVVAAANVGWIVGDAGLAERMADWLQFDRSAVAAGQLWRLVTCHLVHYSAGHFWLDLLPWVAMGLLFERRVGRLWPVATAAAAGAIGLAVWIGQPHLAVYRGWSGLDNTAMALVMIALLREARGVGTDSSRAWVADPTRPGGRMRTRQLLVALVGLVYVSKITFEAVTGRASFSHAPFGAMGTMVPLAHWVGAAAGAATWGAAATAAAWRDLKRTVLVVC